MKEVIQIPEIILNWSDWYKFEDVRKNVKEGGINVPNMPGVYKIMDENGEIIHIGRTSNLRQRVKQGFVKGKSSHSTRERIIKDNINLNELKIQWAITDYPNTVEEFLHKKFKKKYGKLPKYTKIT